MTKEFTQISKNIKRRIFLPLIFSLVLCLNGLAQTQNTTGSTKTDSQYNANQLKMQNDSLEAAKKKTTSTAPKPTDTRPILKRIHFSISTSFWINPSSTFFEFSPVVSYRFPKTYSIGAGPAYIYNHDRTSKISLDGWGGKVFGRAQLLKWVYAYTEYQGIKNEYLSDHNLSTDEVTKSKQYVDSWFLSLGVYLKLTKRHGINLQALYDVLYDQSTSPYYSAWTYRIGFGF
jgi:hypothetical protein